MNQGSEVVCEECQVIFEKNDIGRSRFCPQCRNALTSVSHENSPFHAQGGAAKQESDIFGIFYCNLLGLVVGVPAVLFRGFVFSYGIKLLDILAVIFLMSAGVLSLAIFMQKVSSSRPAKAISWIAITLLIIISYTGYAQAGDLIDPVDRYLMRLITSYVPVLNSMILFVNLFRFSD